MDNIHDEFSWVWESIRTAGCFRVIIETYHYRYYRKKRKKKTERDTNKMWKGGGVQGEQE